MKHLLLLNLLLVGIISCKKPQVTSYYDKNYTRGGNDEKHGLSFGLKDNYDIEVLESGEKPKAAFSLLTELKLTEESPLTDEQQTYKGAMLKRGLDYNQKMSLLNQMVAKAKEEGAHGLMDLKYKAFTTVNTSGYSLTANAFRYTVNQE
ncbi:MAG: hypothetical protein KA313_06770 [Pseudarcicella sp.]|nr:hypothetical protein [Pseudarcicella sp.]MBP6410784.1 hypothetical protein [Pseudarcicella sp.]